MPSVAKLIRNTPTASLRTYFEQAGIDIPIEIRIGRDLERSEW